MTTVITWYDVLGVLPDALPDDIREAWQARKAALQPGMVAGAPPDVLSAVDRALQAVEEAWRVLADPAARESYDEDIGFRRLGEGLTPPSRGPSGPDVSLGGGWSMADEEALEPYAGLPLPGGGAGCRGTVLPGVPGCRRPGRPAPGPGPADGAPDAG